MPKLNLIGMIVLCLAVAAGAGTMALRAPAPRDHAPQVAHLMRQLGDADPDLRRDAERELKQLGPKAEPALKAAANSDDKELAARARAILGMKKPEPPVAPVEAVSKPADLRLTLQITSMPSRPDEPVGYILRLHNGTKSSFALPRLLVGTVADYTIVGNFERIDAEGRLVELPVDPWSQDAKSDHQIVKPGETIDLSPGSGVLRIGARGTFRVRYVLHTLKEQIVSGHTRPEMAKRIESNEVTVTVR
jgi:hypothetical protein